MDRLRHPGVQDRKQRSSNGVDQKKDQCARRNNIQGIVVLRRRRACKWEGKCSTRLWRSIGIRTLDRFDVLRDFLRKRPPLRQVQRRSTRNAHGPSIPQPVVHHPVKAGSARSARIVAIGSLPSVRQEQREFAFDCLSGAIHGVCCTMAPSKANSASITTTSPSIPAARILLQRPANWRKQRHRCGRVGACRSPQIEPLL